MKKKLNGILSGIIALLVLFTAHTGRANASGAYGISLSQGSHMTPVYEPSSYYSSSVYYSNLREVVFTGNQRLDLVNAALSQVGYHEGNSLSQLDGSNQNGSMNYTEYGYWYGKSVLGHNSGFFYEWCAMFTAWSARQARIPVSVISNASYAHAGTNPFYFNVTYHERGSYVPVTGDLIFYDWAYNDRSWDHVGIVLYVENGKVHTVEGNAQDGVILREFPVGYYEIQGYGVPRYSNADSGALDPNKYTEPKSNLSRGDTGKTVKWLQASLLRLGYPVPVDGSFGFNTERQLKRFQAFCGLAESGICAERTIAAINAKLGHGSVNNDDPSTYPVPTRTLRRGCTGRDVKWLQAALKKLGANIDVDGNFGPATEDRVIWAQNRLGLTKDGICGPATRSKLLMAIGTGQTDPSHKPETDPASYPVPTRKLRKTCSGDDVKWLQAALKKYGLNMIITGYFGNMTEANLKYFQQMEGLEADGIFGPLSREKLKAYVDAHSGPAPIGYPEPTRVLKQGCTGNDVRWLQTALKRLGYPITVDGVFGSATEKQLKAFQKAAGLTPDGMCGSETRRAIKNRLR